MGQQTLLNAMKSGNRRNVIRGYPRICASYWAEVYAPRASFFVEKALLSDREHRNFPFLHIQGCEEKAYHANREDGCTQGGKGWDHIL